MININIVRFAMLICSNALYRIGYLIREQYMVKFALIVITSYLLVFTEGGKPEYREKNSRSVGETN